MARAATTPTRRPPSAMAAAKPSSTTVSAATAASARGVPSVRLLAFPAPAPPRKQRACACSPTTHPGSFRCALHRGQVQVGRTPAAAAPASGRLSAARRRMPSMASPLARVAAVDGIRVRPASQPHRRDAFRPGPSRLSAVSYAAADDDEPASSTPPQRFQ